MAKMGIEPRLPEHTPGALPIGPPSLEALKLEEPHEIASLLPLNFVDRGQDKLHTNNRGSRRAFSAICILNLATLLLYRLSSSESAPHRIPISSCARSIRVV